MKRHLPGLLLFALIVGLSIAAYGFIRSISRQLDWRSVPPVIAGEEVPAVQQSEEIKYITRLVQYDHKTRRLTARLEVDRDAIGGRSTMEVTLAVDGSEAGFRSMYFRGIGKVLSGDGQKADIVVDQTIPESLQLNPDANHYAAFRISQGEDSLSTLKPGDFGPEAPIVFVHPRTAVVTRGPVILQ